MAYLHELTEKTSIVSADELLVADSASGFNEKRVTWARFLTGQTHTNPVLNGATGTTLVLSGALTAASFNGLTISSSTGTLTVANGKTVVFNQGLTFTGTNGTTVTFPSTSCTVARTDAANTFTGHQTIEGVTSTGATGTGNLVFATSPTITGMTATATTVVPTVTSFTTGILPLSINRIFKLTHTSAANVTVTDGSFEGQELTFISATAFAHVLDFNSTTNGLHSGTATVYVSATFANQLGANLTIKYVNSRWTVIASNNVTLA